MATITRVKKFPKLRGNWKAVKLTEAASQAFKKGDILKVADGAVTLGAAAAADMTSSSTTFCGIANADASGTTAAVIEVLIPMDSSAQMSLPVEHATPASAVTSVGLINDNYVLTNISTSEGWAVAIDTTSNAIVKVMDIDPEYGTGDVNGYVWVKPLSASAFGMV